MTKKRPTSVKADFITSDESDATNTTRLGGSSDSGGGK